MRLVFVVALLCSMGVHAGERLALVVGVNRGLETDEALRFAERDAERMRDALTDVGGFSPASVTLVRDVDATQLRAALERLRTQLAAKPHERLIIFVSSHAGEGGLHLDGTELPLDELVTFLKAAPVQVGLLVVDACQSGKVTKTKGLKPVAAVPRMEAANLEGRVLISASGADEYAQESDALQGSYFTHYLVSGLRGAADSSHDGEVTLDEAYSWAWARTVEATFSSRAGVQRPAYSVNLQGEGQLVLSKLAATSSRLTLNMNEPGRWLIIDGESGNMVADLDKPTGPLTLAVPPGRYRVQGRLARGAVERSVTVPPTGVASLASSDFEAVAPMAVARKGGDETRLVLSLSGGVASGFVRGLTVQPGGDLRLRRDGHLGGFLNHLSGTLSLRGGEPASSSFRQLEVELRAGLGHRFAWTSSSLAVGLEAGPLLIQQWDLPDQSSRTSLGLTACLGLELRVRLSGPVEFFALGAAGGSLIKRVAGLDVAPRISGSLGVAVAL